MSEPSSASSRRCFPDWVLLDPIARVAPLKNATTAGTMTSALFPIDVSFEVVDPPGLSRCVLNCPELKADVIGAHRVIAADGAFLLIIVGFPDRIVRRMRNDVFVYSAGPGTPPLLRRLPSFPDNIYSNHAGVLSCGDGHCLVVCPNRRLDDDDHHQMIISYDLEVFSTETNSWTTRSARVPSDLQGRCSPLRRHQPNKVFSVGGNSLAWVDMSLGVLLCDLLCNDPMVRLIDLPPLLPANKVYLGGGSLGDLPPMLPANKVYLGGGSLGPKRILRATRDVICKDGWIRCIEIEFPELIDINPKFHWNAIMSKRRMFSSDEWETFTMESASLSACFPDPLFPEICDGNGKLTLDKVMSTAPILDAHHENVVYMRSGVNPCDPNGWVFAIDIKDKKLLTAVPFTVRKFYFNHFFLQCDFSKYIRKVPEILSMAKASEKCTNREKIVLLESHLLAALDQLNNIEIHVASVKRRLSGSMSPLCSGQGNIQKASEHGLDHGRGKYVTYPVDECLQSIRDMDLHISADVDATKNTIRVAHDALCKLVQNLSPNVLDEEIVEYEALDA